MNDKQWFVAAEQAASGRQTMVLAVEHPVSERQTMVLAVEQAASIATNNGL